MADKSQKWAENVKGKFYVDETCISCDACCTTAPQFFGMDDDDGHAFVKDQPKDAAGEDLCKEAMEGCPVEAIGNDGEE